MKSVTSSIVRAKPSLLSLVGLALLLPLAQVQGQIINVEMTNGRAELNGQPWSPSVSPLSYPGTTWTLDGNNGGPSNFTNLPYSNGAPSTVGYTLFAQGQANNGVSPLTMFDVADYTTSNYILTINGLVTGREYNVYLDGAFNGNGTTFTIDGHNLTTTGDASGSSFVSGVNFVEFNGIDAMSNSINITVAPNDTGFGILNGFQIVAGPEPSTWALMLGGLALLAFYARRKGVWKKA